MYDTLFCWLRCFLNDRLLVLLVHKIIGVKAVELHRVVWDAAGLYSLSGKFVRCWQIDALLVIALLLAPAWQGTSSYSAGQATGLERHFVVGRPCGSPRMNAVLPGPRLFPRYHPRSTMKCRWFDCYSNMPCRLWTSGLVTGAAGYQPFAIDSAWQAGQAVIYSQHRLAVCVCVEVPTVPRVGQN